MDAKINGIAQSQVAQAADAAKEKQGALVVDAIPRETLRLIIRIESSPVLSNGEKQQLVKAAAVADEKSQTIPSRLDAIAATTVYLERHGGAKRVDSTPAPKVSTADMQEIYRQARANVAQTEVKNPQQRVENVLQSQIREVDSSATVESVTASITKAEVQAMFAPKPTQNLEVQDQVEVSIPGGGDSVAAEAARLEAIQRAIASFQSSATAEAVEIALPGSGSADISAEQVAAIAKLLAPAGAEPIEVDLPGGDAENVDVDIPYGLSADRFV